MPSPQSKSHHSPSTATARALTLRAGVGRPELVPNGMIFKRRDLPFLVPHEVGRLGKGALQLFDEKGWKLKLIECLSHTPQPLVAFASTDRELDMARA